MTGRMLVKVGMVKRVRDWLAANPIGYAQGDELAAQFTRKVERIEALQIQKETGEQASRSSTRHRQELRRTMTRVTLRHVLKVAKSLALSHPDVASGIKRPPPGKSEETFLASAQAIVAQVEGNKPLFLQFGMSEDGLAELTQQLADYEGSMKEAHAGRRAHTGAQAELRDLVKELILVVQTLDGIVGLKFRDRSELVGAWKSARNVAWPTAPKVVIESEQRPAA
jgi:hypothetical protein